jgi:hypothetical protein
LVFAPIPHLLKSIHNLSPFLNGQLNGLIRRFIQYFTQIGTKTCTTELKQLFLHWMISVPDPRY